MPKIQAIDSKTGIAHGAPQSAGRVIKANTNANPTRIQEPAPVVTPPTTEAKTVPTEGQAATTEVKAEAIPLPPQYEGLAKKESALHTREQEIKAREAAIDAKVKAAVDEALNQYKGRLKQKPLAVLNEEGLTYDHLVEQAVNEPDPATRTLQQKIETIEANQRKLVEDSQKAADNQRQAAIKQITFDVTELVESDPQFETIKATSSIDDVVELITKTFDETGRLMTVEQAAKKVEDNLFEEALKLTSLSKVKAKLTPAVVEAAKTETKQTPQATTLTNTMSSKRPMSARERAIAAFKGEKF